MAFAQYANYDALGLAELVAKREVSAAELVEEAIARIEKHNPKLNAVIFKTYDRARSAAKLPLQGPFAGVPFLLKDILGAQKGVPSRQGSNFIPPVPAPHDATIVRRFTGAGLIYSAKRTYRSSASCQRPSPRSTAPATTPGNSITRRAAPRVVQAQRSPPGSCP